MITPAGIRLPADLYDDKADGPTQVREANKRARKDSKRTLIMWGENWCEFCVHLDLVMHNDPRIAELLDGDFELVKVDLGKPPWSKHLQLAEFYKTPMTSAPTLTVVDPATDQMLAVFYSKDALAKPMTLQPVKVFEPDPIVQFLSNFRPAPKVATSVLAEARAAAGRAQKKTLVHFERPMCEACRGLESWLADPSVAAILDKAFVVVKIDSERMVVGQTTLVRFAGAKQTMPPWVVVLSTDGSPAVAPDANGKAGVPGLPRNEAEVEPFVQLLAKSSDRLTDEDVDSLRASLRTRLGKPAAEGAEKPAPKP